MNHLTIGISRWHFVMAFGGLGLSSCRLLIRASLAKNRAAAELQQTESGDSWRFRV